ncbi:hypothetical protein AB6A40_008311 [Gnathostoma spinigerum]|uniref:Uncharacterized protein n=1 Tax=Gnathostoma spinigerum TaxID=75299 RepID=A0ABD6EY32_9BILA
MITFYHIYSNSYFISLFFLVSPYVLSINGVFVQSSDTATTLKPCKFDILSNSQWSQCMCENTDESNIHIRCRLRSWITVPKLPKVNDRGNNDSTVNVVAVTITDSALTFIAQDAFKNQSVQVIDLSNNHLEVINVNAFRGLEDTLYQLSLNHNNLFSIPTWALTYLHRLQYLYIQHNMISEIKSSTFDETQLKHLHFLHLDHNQFTILPQGCFYRLPLHVLTLSNNRVIAIEKRALPPSLWFLDLKNNVLQEIPYSALRELQTLRTLDLEGNNITKVESYSEVRFPAQIDLILSNNRIKELRADAFNSFTKFNKLDLSYNQISLIEPGIFNSVSYVRQLDFSYNQIVNIPMGTFGNVAKSLQSLNLEENRLHALPTALRQLRALEHLNLNNNKLVFVDNATLIHMKSSITELLLAFNRFTRVPTDLLDGMTRLTHLDLSKNRIQSISRLAFGTLDKTGMSLRRLNLAGNYIEQITDSATFLYMSALAYLDISHNRIHQLSPNAFERLEGLESLFLQVTAIE